MRKKFDGDSIKIDIDTGGNKAGNGGNVNNEGNIVNKPTIVFSGTNKVEGADVHNNTGDQVRQKADWDADGGKAEAKKFSKAYGGDAKSYGDQKSDHDGDNTGGDVTANTSAHQKNYVSADQSQYVKISGGDGGEGSLAFGGEVNVNLDHFIV
jgi:hypothetical protein